jgi:hypothetical protein
MDDKIKAFVMDFGKKYGYNFEHEATYERMCLVNDAVYIAKIGWHVNPRKIGKWDATGKQFKEPFVFKTLFSHDPIEFRDLCEAKQVKTALYLDMDSTKPMTEEDVEYSPQFIGKVGLFCPIKPGHGGGLLLREKDGQFHAATGTKGYFWLEAEMVKALGKEKDIDMSYYETMVNEAVDKMDQFGDVEWFMGNDKIADKYIRHESIVDPFVNVHTFMPEYDAA